MKKKLYALLACALLATGLASALPAPQEEATGIIDTVEEMATTRRGHFDFSPVFGGISLGMINTMGAPDPVDIKMPRSLEVSWLYMIGVKVKRGINSLSVGLGLDWRNYRIYNDYQWVKAGGEIGLAPYPDGADHRWSRLKTFALQIPVMYTVKPWRDLRISLGPVLNFTTHSSLKSGWEADGRKWSVSDTNVYPRLFTVDAMGLVTYSHIGVYCRYAPMKVLKDGRGPQFSSLSLGLIIGF